MMFHIMECPHKLPVILPVISVRSDMESRSSPTFEPSRTRCKKPFSRSWSEFRDFAERKKALKWYFFNPFCICTLTKRPRIKILRKPNDFLGRNTPFYFNTSKKIFRVATDYFKCDNTIIKI